MDGFTADISSLSNLLSESDILDEEKVNQTPNLTPATIVNTIHQPSQIHPQETPQSKDIWDIDEIPDENDILDDPHDSRLEPKYQIVMKQDVGTEDVFLGLGNKTPSSSDCTHIVIKIYFPGCSLPTINLDVKPTLLRADSPTQFFINFFHEDLMFLF